MFPFSVANFTFQLGSEALPVTCIKDNFSNQSILQVTLGGGR